jgi:hypothetical protein
MVKATACQATTTMTMTTLHRDARTSTMSNDVNRQQT